METRQAIRRIALTGKRNIRKALRALAVLPIPEHCKRPVQSRFIRILADYQRMLQNCA